MGIACGRVQNRGFSLLELMLALALGVPLSILAVQLFALGHRASVLLREEAFLQHSARAVSQLLHREIRQAGYGLCRGAGGGLAVTVRHRAELAPFFQGVAVRGFGTGAPPPGAWAGDALPGTDSILLSRGAGEKMRAAILRHSTPHLYLARGAGLRPGAVVLLSDAQCRQGTLLQLSGSSGLRLDYGPGGVVPGNCSVALGGNGDCNARSSLRAHRYAPGSQVLGWRAVAYYAGTDTSGAPALFREQLFANERGLGSRAQAVAPAVEGLHILYGVADGAPVNASVGRYLEAAEVERAALWSRVQAVRLRLQLRSRVALPALFFTRDEGDAFLRRTLHFSVALRNGATP